MAFFLFSTFAVIACSGCAAKTKPFIPELLAALKGDMARIIVPRESQLTGSRWDLDLVDLGNNIESNGMISYRFHRTDYFISLEGLPRS